MTRGGKSYGRHVDALGLSHLRAAVERVVGIAGPEPTPPTGPDPRAVQTAINAKMMREALGGITRAARIDDRTVRRLRRDAPGLWDAIDHARMVARIVDDRNADMDLTHPLNVTQHHPPADPPPPRPRPRRRWWGGRR